MCHTICLEQILLVEGEDQPDAKLQGEARGAGTLLGDQPAGEEEREARQANLHPPTHRGSKDCSGEERYEETLRDHKSAVGKNKQPHLPCQIQEWRDHHWTR